MHGPMVGGQGLASQLVPMLSGAEYKTCGTARLFVGCRPRGGKKPPVSDLVELIRVEHARISQLINEVDSVLADVAPAEPGSELHLVRSGLAGFLEFHIDAAEEICYQALARAEPDVAHAIEQARDADADIRRAIENRNYRGPGRGNGIWPSRWRGRRR
jgi:hypothetical protein